MNPPITLGTALQDAIHQGLDRLDAQMLMLFILNQHIHDRAWLYSHDEIRLIPSQYDQYAQYVAERLSGKPLAYLTGEIDFFGMTLMVTSDVLIPRSDTEVLVNWTLECLNSQPISDIKKFIDLGCGSGAVALAIKKNIPSVTVQAVDASNAALLVAKQNAKRLGLVINFSQGDWLTGCDKDFDLIASNPPYIAENDPHLTALTYEPIKALTSGIDGLNDIRVIIRRSTDHLKNNGYLLIEHGWNQTQSVQCMMHESGFVDIETRQDLAELDRVTKGTLR